MILIDTHVLIWAVNNDQRLGRIARETIDAETDAGTLYVSAITPWEISLLVNKGRLSFGRDAGEWILDALDMPGVMLAPIEPMIAVNSVTLPGQFHPDPADRFIVATARHHRWPLLTADRAILVYGDAGHVEVMDAAL